MTDNFAEDVAATTMRHRTDAEISAATKPAWAGLNCWVTTTTSGGCEPPTPTEAVATRISSAWSSSPLATSAARTLQTPTW